MRSLPEVFSTLGKPFAIHKANRPHVAPSALGPGHCRATTHGPREPQIHLRRCRVFYQMDRCEGSINNNIEDCQKFFWKNIVCRFGVPSELTVDNGKQFDSQDFRDFSSPLAPSLPLPQCTTHNPTASWSAPTARFSRQSRKCSSTTRRANGSTCYLKQCGN
jgi:hypothetical protein